MAGKRDVRVCIDRVLPEEYAPARRALERELGTTAPGEAAPPGRAAAGPPGVMRLSLVVLKKWPNGSELRCRFLDGSSKQKRRVEGKAHLWEEHANVSFRFVTRGAAEIRISFSADDGSWSALGTDALIKDFFPPFQPTMNYGWLEDDSPDDEYERVVVHEFGHALGAIHEHQSPEATLDWNEAEVFRVFSGPPNFWDRAAIEHNILRRYSRQHTNSSAFDPDSIMLYSFPGELFKSGKGTKSNRKLSTKDKKFIGQMYPRANPRAAGGSRRSR
jgi:hypothetical protein